MAAWFATRTNTNAETPPEAETPSGIVSDMGSHDSVPVVPAESVTSPVETVPFSEPKAIQLCFLDIVTDKPIPGITLKFGDHADSQNNPAMSDSQGMVTVSGIHANSQTKVEAVVSDKGGGASFHLSWPGDFEREAPSLGSNLFLARVPLYSRLCLRVSGLDPGSVERIEPSAQPVPPLPASDHPAYRSLKMQRESFPMSYSAALRSAGVPCPYIAASIEFDSAESAWIVLVPYTGDMAVQMLLKDRAPVARLLACRQGTSQDIFISMPPSPTVTGLVRLDGRPVVNTRVTIACTVELNPSELVAEQKIAGVALVQRHDTQITTATFAKWVKTNSSGHFSLDVPFTGRVAVAAFEVRGNSRIKFFESPHRDLSADISIDATSDIASTARMRIVHATTGQVMSNTDLWFGVRDDPFALSYPPTRSDSDGWFTIEDIKALPMVDFVVEVDPKRSVRVAAKPQPGGDVRVNH
jgi:hypothetical protein